MAQLSPQHIPHFGDLNQNEQPGFTMVFEKLHVENGIPKAVSDPIRKAVQPFKIDQSDDPMKVHQSTQEDVHEKGTQHRGRTQRPPEGSAGKHDSRVARKGNDGYKAGVESPSHHAYQGRHGSKPGSPYAERKSVSEGGIIGNTVAGIPGRSRLRPSVEMPDRGTVLPKFGAWDETDPTAGEGYTTIFNQARTEKETGRPTWIPSTDPSSATRYSQRRQKPSSSGQCCTIL